MDNGFHVSSVTGFLPDVPPLKQLPEPFQPWENLVDHLPELLKTKRLREEVDNLPLITVSDSELVSERHWHRAYKVLTFLSQGYLWQNGEDEGVLKLPRQLAIPWWEVSQRLGLPPVATYAAVVLWNWKLKDLSAPIAFENLQIELTYTGTKDEEWFYMISAAVELAAVKGIERAQICLEEVASGQTAKVTESLEAINTYIHAMVVALEKMYQNCGKQFFYSDIRIWQAGTKKSKTYPDGIIFEGVSPEKIGYSGASAAESAAIPVFDILLGVEHKGEVKEFLDLQRWNMPRPHRQFLLMLSSKPSLRAFVAANKGNKQLSGAYDKCIQAMCDFRNKHIIMVKKYIVDQAAKAQASNEAKDQVDSKGIVGTGGTSLEDFLISSRNETSQNKLN